MHLQLLVADLFLDAEALEGQATVSLPRLPALESLLRLGAARPNPAGWRAALARALGLGQTGELPPAHLAAAALRLPRDANPWLATPVHCTAALDHLRLHPAGVLTLEAAESAVLADQFGQLLGDSGLQLLPLFGGFLLQGLPARQLSAPEPARFLGANLSRAPATGPDAAAVRRLSGECEMWLHDHPLNLQRRQRGQLAVNGLWIWGGGPGLLPMPSDHAGSATRVWANDAVSAGLCALARAESSPVPAGFAAWQQEQVVLPGDAPSVVVLPSVPRGPGDQPLQRLEQDWFAPAWQALQAGQLQSLQLSVAGRCWRLSRWHRWRFWHATRPWWQQVAL
jgi:hypothetical protein